MLRCALTRFVRTLERRDIELRIHVREVEARLFFAQREQPGCDLLLPGDTGYGELRIRSVLPQVTGAVEAKAVQRAWKPPSTVRAVCPTGLARCRFRRTHGKIDPTLSRGRKA